MGGLLAWESVSPSKENGWPRALRTLAMTESGFLQRTLERDN